MQKLRLSKVLGTHFYDLPEAGVRIDLDNDGVKRSTSISLRISAKAAPLKMVAFKFRSDKYQNNKSRILRAFKADEIFASGEYPTIQNARYISVADFNSDGEPDIVTCPPKGPSL